MDTKFNYTIVGLFVLLIGTVMIAAAFWLSAEHHTKTYHNYLVFMNEAVSGLSEQADVKFNGVKVGYVKEISLNPKNPQQVRLLLAIEQGTPITTSTVATLESQGITGITYIGLKALTPLAPKLLKAADEPYPVIKSSPSLLVRLDTTLRNVTANIEKLAESVQETFSAQNQQNLAKTLQNVEKITAVLAKNSKELDNSIQSINKVLQNSAIVSQALPATMKEIQKTLVAARALTKNLTATGKEINRTIHQSQLLLENFANQTLPSTTTALTKLDGLLDNMKQVSEKMAENPAVIIRGNLPPPPGPGEQ